MLLCPILSALKVINRLHIFFGLLRFDFLKFFTGENRHGTRHVQKEDNKEMGVVYTGGETIQGERVSIML